MPDVHLSTTHHNWMVNQRMQDGGSSVLPTTQQLTTCSVAKSPDSLPHSVQLILNYNAIPILHTFHFNVAQSSLVVSYQQISTQK
jgi:hypothetical protein